jgi:hypothetical protein
MAKRAAIYIALILALAIGVQGCYTMIRHPKVDYVDHSADYYTENCFSCHENLNEYPYGSDYASFPGYWRFYHNWGEYYSFPWWWESYWWDIHVDENENADDYYPGGRIDRRRGLFPGDAWQYVPPPNEITGQSAPSGGSSGGGTASTADDNSDDTKTKDPNNQPEQKEPPKKPERRRLPK